MANNVIVMVVVISISGLVLKHRTLSGGIGVNLGPNIVNHKPKYFYSLLTTGRLLLPLRTTKTRGHTNDPSLRATTPIPL